MVEVENLDCPSPHAIAAPAEDHRVDPPGQDPLDKHLSLTTMQNPADDIAHELREASTHPEIKQRSPC
jgi:hypothetical protein